MNFHHNPLRNKKGIGTVFGMVFFLLIVMVVFASFVIVLNQNTSLEQVTISAKQLDLDRYTELTTVSITNPQVAVLNSKVYISCTITNTGTLPTQLVRLWIKDNTTDTIGNTIMSPSIILQPGSNIQYFNSTLVANSSPLDQFSFWFMSTRGNPISAFPNTNQLNGIPPVGNFPGVADINSTYQTDQYHPLQLSLNTTKPNQLIYVVVSFDDGNILYTPTSNPSLTWTLRATSLHTDQNSGDSILKTFYAIKPTSGPITINIQSTADEYDDYYCSALAFAISDVNTASPFDGSAQTTIGRSSMPQDTINTRYQNDFIIGALGIDDLNPPITPGAGFGQIMPVQSSYGAAGEPDSMPRSVWSEWAIMADPRNNLPVNCTFPFSEDWAIIVDAVRLVVVPPTAPVSLSPNTGPIGQPVTVSGQGFAVNSQLIATFDGSQIPFSFTTDGSGNIPPKAIFTVPQGSTAGIKNVTIIDSKFNFASASFTVTTPIITVAPQNGPVGTVVTVAGSNFITNSTITIKFDGNPIATAPSPLTADATGGFSATLNLNFNETAGVKTVLASDGVNSASATFTVIPSIALNPVTGVIGSTVNVFGYGFASSQPVTVIFASSTVVTIPANVNTDGLGFFSASFIIPTGQTAGKNVIATDGSSNSATSTFAVTPSISLNATNGNAGLSVTVSGSGFAATKTITATFAGSSVTLSGITSTDATGSFSGATFTVPTSTAGAQTLIIKDASSNSGSVIYTVNTIYQSISVAMINSAPAATVTINGGYPSPNAFAADGKTYNIMMVAGASFTMSFSNGGNHRNGFSVSSVFSATSSSYTASTNSLSLTAYEQVQNTFSATIIGGNPPNGDFLVLTGTYLGAPGAIITTLNVGGRSSASNSGVWSDYNTPVTFPATSAISGGTGYTNERWAIVSASSTAALTNGGGTYPKTYYHQFLQTLSYSVFGGGLPTAPTATGTTFGAAYAPSLTNAATSYWFDTLGSIIFSTSAGGVGEQWAPVPTSISGTTLQTQIVSMHHQYQVSFSQTGIDSSAGTNPVLTIGSTNYAYNSLPTNAWVDNGAIFSWLSLVSGGASKQFVNTGSSGTSPISAPGAYTGTYKTQYQHTITSSPATGSGYITVDGVAQSTPYTTPWWDSSSTHTIVASSTVTIVAGQRQYQYLSWSDTGAQSHTISPIALTTYTANFQQQYYFTVSSTYDNPTGSGWYNAGTSISSTVTTPVSGGTGIRYTTTGWIGTGSLSSGGTAGSSSTGSFTINAYTTCTWNWKTQYQVTFTASALGSVASSTRVLNVGGSDVLFSQLPYTNWFDSGASFSYYSTVAGSVSGTQFALTGTSPGSPISGTTGTTVTGTYKTQYQLTVTSAAGTSGGQSSGYYDAGTSITSSISATVNVAGPPIISYTTAGFTGTGNAPSSGSGTTVSFTLTQQSSITWHWNGQMTLYPDASISENIISETPFGSDHSVDVSDSNDNTYVYVGSNSGTYSDSYSLQSVGSLSGTISSVTQYARIYVTSTNGPYAATSLTLGGSTLTSNQFTPTLTNTFTTHSDTFTRPGGGTWTMTDLNNLQSGLTLHRSSGTTIRCSEVWIVVNFST